MIEVGLLAISGFLFSFLVGTLAEYVVHRLMHRRVLLGDVHIDHHQKGFGQGWLIELRDYLIPSLPPIVCMFLISWLVYDRLSFGLGCVAGGVVYGMFAAYAHQLQHEFPEQAFWMPQPVHYIHHAHRMWHHNFGISFDIWDRICGTYKRVDWRPERKRQFRRFFQINWIKSPEQKQAELQPINR